ncbi:hypothetical protein MGG_09086 [Pyricularia oryzae 70-15]|uniref:Uncharacterized protein n=3 Tax=Pyricularia oryzae TaxID=318829 RepID=G4MZT8_PYRO7|nr:uncharacterized protein MGG_09086 [Pyricularia oryzae 70-15]EHA51382.1 hypothetical protein MGG_09086 [Pyricularia oryzae 70-15]ELQ34990.1 hypothetical protein OOU_Y34scaffold00734g1 [Pyricularia oryzae Y34]
MPESMIHLITTSQFDVNNFACPKKYTNDDDGHCSEPIGPIPDMPTLEDSRCTVYCEKSVCFHCGNEKLYDDSGCLERQGESKLIKGKDVTTTSSQSWTVGGAIDGGAGVSGDEDFDPARIVLPLRTL